MYIVTPDEKERSVEDCENNQISRAKTIEVTGWFRLL